MSRNEPFDAITLEVVRNKLESIANEMQTTLLRSSFSPAVKESLDASASLFTVAGTPLAQATAIPIHLGTLVPAVASVLSSFPVAGMKPGDAFVLNDPYAGGTHLPDLAIVMPVIHEGRPIALAACMTHHQDVGGISAGSIPTHATEIFQEGIRIPPLKLLDGDEMNETFIKLVCLNVRLPDFFLGDLNAQIAACKIGARRVLELAHNVGGGETATGLFDELLDRSERLTKEAIRRLPQGTYRYVEYLDNDGVDLDQRIRVEVAATVENETITFDFTGTSPQVRGPINCVASGALAAAFFAVRALCGPSIPTNGGCFRPLRLVLPEGSLVNPREPAPVNARTNTIKAAACCMLGAFREILPEQLGAADSGDLHTIMWSGKRLDGRPFVVMEIFAGGSGARAGHDGVDVCETDVTNGMNLPVEAFEMEAPVRVLRMEAACDSGGAGATRGGLGIHREYEMLADVTLVHRGERFYSAPQGLRGGLPGASAGSTIHRKDGAVEQIRSKEVVQFEAGDRLTLTTAGGAGYGQPVQRGPEALAADLADRKISARASREHYGRAT
jgi:N-methylhydantoinase B